MRTGNGGSDPKFLIKDLGFYVPTGAAWTPMDYVQNLGPGNPGQFSQAELREAIDLATAIENGDLEWSKDCVTQETGDFVIDETFGLAKFRMGEALGPIDNFNVVFATSERFRHDPLGSSIGLYYNGQRLVLVDDYAVSESGGPGAGFDTITTTFTPLTSDRLYGDYITD